ncbi:MAG: hypothetical protein Q8J78_07085 [Moraxellaceae bacterium]|nr:hypothetical protein [Moraxellaceae bacterium]
MPIVCRSILLALLLALGACGDEPTATQSPGKLMSVTREDANGHTTALTRFDYRNGQLVRVRHYSGPGEDNTFGNSDDVMSYWEECRIENTGDVLLELQVAQLSQYTFYASSQGCEHHGLQASHVQTTRFTSPGPDDVWLTDDDPRTEVTALARTPAGSRRTYNQPDCAACSSSETDVEYSLDANGRLESIRTGADMHTRFYYTAGGKLQKQGIYSYADNIAIREMVIRETYSETHNGFDVSTDYLLQPGTSMSPTGQILVAVLGVSYTGDFVMFNDVMYERFEALGQHYSVQLHSGNVHKIHNTRAGNTITLHYALP